MGEDEMSITMWGFSSAEIGQLIRFFERLCVSDGRGVLDKRRTPSLSVRQYLISCGFMTEDWEITRLHEVRNSIYAALPPEALWRIVKEMFMDGEKTIGRSIAKHDNWERYLNIWKEGRKLHRHNDIDDMRRVLNILCSYGYIHFQEAGSVWEITIRGEKK